ncbi:MAG: type II toxin-antitoxin system VapB family antitoxin [Spirulinaceae cyanobacterium RM2_2_10]|nr:type II toxin-antitoxin system VapB family antitoxin [Spirulinaceae cyanobacterium SM2_1_0]NJO19415.1 type II toxin-antitoxin system VapB family antitoxin [Spirulinaceae cyanobacterium RM2_2_10]
MRAISAINIDDRLYQKAATLAQQLHIEPEALVTIALQDYIRSHSKALLCQSLDSAYAGGLDESEQLMLEAMRHHQRQLWSDA